MKKTGYAIVSLLLALSLMAGCASAARPTGKPADGTASVVNPPSKAVQAGADWLTDREWTISGFNTGNQFVPLEPGHGGDAWVYFAADGTLNGYTGSNNFRGTWKLGARNSKGAYPIVVSVGPMTKKAAINEIAARFEITYLEDLQRSVSAVPVKSGIELYGTAGNRLLSFLFLGVPAAK